MLVFSLATILLGACTQSELRGEGREEAIYPGESVTGRSIPYTPDPDSVLSPEDFAYPDEEAIFPGETVTGRTVPYVPDTDSVPPPQDFGDSDVETFVPAESVTVRTMPEDPGPRLDDFAEISPDASAELPEIPEAAVVAVQTTSQKTSLAVLEEKIDPEKVLFPDAEEEIISEEKNTATAVEREEVPDEETTSANEAQENDIDATVKDEPGREVEVVRMIEEKEESLAAADGEEEVSEREMINTVKTTIASVENRTLPENLPFAVVELTHSEQPNFFGNRHAASNEILVEEEEQTGFASEEMFAAVDETKIPGATTVAALADTAASMAPTTTEQTEEKLTSVAAVGERPPNAPGSGFGNALAFAGELGGAQERSTYPTKKGGAGRYEPAPDPDDPPRGIFGTKGISLFSNPLRRTESENRGNISINSFLWRAALETLSFMPLASADPFGGVIITDWHINPESADERFKVVAYILDSSLRIGALRISVFRQQMDSSGAWQDAVTDENVHVQLETTILNRARQLRLTWIEEQEG